MIKKYSLVFIALLCSFFYGFGQTTIYSESMYNGTGGTSGNSIGVHESNNRFNEDALTYSGTGDVRTTNASSGYAGSTGTWNVMLNNSTETLIMDGISVVSYNNLVFSFGVRKGTLAEDGSGLVLEYSTTGTGGTYTAISFPSLPTGSGTATWHYRSSTSTIPSNVTTIRFRSTNNVEWRIDDLLLEGDVASTAFVDFCNVQSPANGSMIVGGAFNVYAQTYEPGVTDTAGQGAGITAWIGYSTSDTDPSTWPAGNWVAATYNTDSGNNDEYVANVGAGLPSGTYYYASRFQLNGGPYRYGGYNGGFWDGTTNVNGVLTVDKVDFCNLQFPGTGTINLGDTFAVYGQVFEAGVTPGAGQGNGITAWIGYSPTDTNPNTWTNWIPAAYNAACSDCNGGQNDEYSADIGSIITIPGDYFYATRFELNSGAYSYGGILADGSAGNFWDGTTYISGTLSVVAPEIDVERNTGSSIPNGSAANAGYNTIFATTTVGNTTAPKTYHVANEGTANLALTSITSSNPAEFSISLNPGATTINPSTEVDFEITFSPTGIGLRTATITIVSDDADENPYTFNVQGNGDCASGTLTFLPDNGPVGTIVNVTSSTSNFGGSTTATIGGIPASVTVIAANEIEVTIPAGASTGSLEINDDLGCLNSDLFTVIDELISSCEGNSGLTPTDLFISEVTDKGTGSHSYVEIYNGTGGPITLNTYELRIHNNGAANATTTIPLIGTPTTIADDGIIVIAFGGTNANDPEGGYTADFFSGGGGINEDDHIRLYNGTTWIDLWGDTSGNPFTIASKDYTYRRKNSGITVPSIAWQATDWESFTPVDYSDIGNFDFSTGVPPSISVEPNFSVTSCDLTASISVTASEGFTGGNPLAYQWYYSAPGDLGWTSLSDDATYSGTTTATLNILSTVGLDNYQYYCQVREDGNTCYTASNATRLTVESTIWYDNSGTLEWSNGIPGLSTIAVIDANYVTNTSGNINACNLIINSNKTLTVSNSTFVNVVNDVTNYGTIDIKTRGSFVQQGDGAAAGTFTNSGAGIATLNKHTATFNSNTSQINYTYWSSPVNDPSNPGYGEDISSVFPTPVGNRKYYFTAQNYIDSFIETANNNDNSTLGQDDIDDNSDDWTYASGAMEIGRGYAVTTAPPVFPGPYFDASTVFSGALNTGDITVTLYKNNNEVDDNNWNFIGNPYPSAISVDDFFAANATVDDVAIDPGQNFDGLTEGAIFLWSQSIAPDANNNGNENINFSQSDYSIINRVAETAGSNNNNKPSRYIPSGQGFFVALTENLSNPVNSVTSGNVVFKNSMRRTGNNTQFFEANNSTQEDMTNLVYENNILWLNLTSDNGVFSQIAVAYAEGATDAYDGWSYDTPRNLSTGTYATLYSIIDSSGRQFAIQGKSPQSLTLNEIIPLGFDTSIGEATIYTFSISQLEGNFLSQNDIFIKDHLLNKVHNLKESDYSFTSEPGEFTDRFEIVFTRETLSVNEAKLDNNVLQIIELPNGDVQFKLSSPFEMKSIEIVDLLGRTLYLLEAQGNSQTFSLSNLSQATYLAKVKLSNGKEITKKAIKRK